MQRLNFQQRTCSVFVQREYDNLFVSNFKLLNHLRRFRNDKKSCICNHPHSPGMTPDEQKPWNWKNHTKTEPTEHFGILPHSDSPVCNCVY
jgi:hypothetical protein